MSKRRSAGKTATGVPFKPGADPRRGKGPRPGEGGRPTSLVRLACRLAFDQRIPVLTKIADGKIADTSPGDRIRAMDTLGKYGGLNYSESEVRAEPFAVRVDIGQREADDRAFLLREFTAMQGRIEAAKGLTLPDPSAPVRGASLPNPGDGHNGNGSTKNKRQQLP